MPNASRTALALLALGLLGCGGPAAGTRADAPRTAGGPAKIAAAPGDAGGVPDGPANAETSEADAERSAARCRESGDLVCEARALLALSALQLARGAREAAVASAEGVAALLAVEQGLEPLDRADLLVELGLAWDSLGEIPKALACYEAALFRYRAVYPFAHPSTAAALNNMGVALLAAQRYEEALARFGEALTIDRAALGAGHPSVAADLYGVGAALCRLGDGQAALAYFDQAIRIWERALPADDPQLAAARRWREVAAAMPARPRPYAPPTEVGTRLTRAEIQAGMQAVAPVVKRCGQGQTGTVTVRVTIAPTGRVVDAAATGQFAGTPTGTCAALAARTARFPQAEQPVTVTYPFRF